MEALCRKKIEDPLSFSLMSFVVPPLRMLSAAMWQVTEQRQVEYYGMLEEFVTLVTESVPELLNFRQRAQLILGLRAKLILELCRGKHPVKLEDLKPHLDRIRAPRVNSTLNEQVLDEDVEESESSFLDLIQTLIKDPLEREHFFQDIFPVEYGPRFDKALQILMEDFILQLERMISVPDLSQLVSWLRASPSLLDECLKSISVPKQMKTLLDNQRATVHYLETDSLRSAHDNCIIASLSFPSLVRVIISSDHTESGELPKSGINLDYLKKDNFQSSRYLSDHPNISSWTAEKRTYKKETNEVKTEEDDEDNWPVLSDSPPLLDLSLPHFMDKRNRDEDSTLNQELNQTQTRRTSKSCKRKREDNADIPMKLPVNVLEIKSEVSKECTFVNPWGAFTEEASKVVWSDQETLCLIDIWGKDSVQRSLKDCLRNRHIFNLISKQMHKSGFSRTAEQCHTRIKRLKMSFRQCYENNLKGGERQQCKFYNQLEKILCSKDSTDHDDSLNADNVRVTDTSIGQEGENTNDWEFLGHFGLEGTRNVPWTDAETNTLISIWGEERIQRELRGVHQNGHIFAIISKKMSAHGYIRTAEQCQTRVKRLKLCFKQSFDSSHTDSKERVEFKFYKQMERIMGNEVPTQILLPEASCTSDIKKESTGSEYQVYTYQEIEGAMTSMEERKKVLWSDAETMILLQLWGDEEVQQNLQRCPHNSHIYSEISEKLNTHGYSRSPEQCHTRIKRLKISYRQQRDSLSLPEAERVEFKFYDLMEEIFKKKSSSKQTRTLDNEPNTAITLEKESKDSGSGMDNTASGSWSDSETVALIDIWAEDEVQVALRDSIHNGHVFADIAEKLNSQGYLKTPEQCRWKIKTLRKNFRQCYERKKCGRDKVGYKFYDKLEQVLGYEAFSMDVFDEQDDPDADSDGLRFAFWSEPETLALIEIWGKEDVQQSLKNSIRNGHIFAEISEKMMAMGFSKTAEQCRKKITKLRKRYRQCLKSRIQGGKPMLFRYYRFLEPVLANDQSLTTLSMDTEPQQAAVSTVVESSRKMPWSDHETQALLEIWGEDRVQHSLRNCLKNRHIYKYISKRMMVLGFIRTGEQCHSRVKRLKAQFYNDSREECKFYKQLEQIILKEKITDRTSDDTQDISDLESITDSDADYPALSKPLTGDGPKLPWGDGETQALISIWGSNKIQEKLRGCVKNRPVFNQIAEAMAEVGYRRTTEQCQSRIKRLKASYRQCLESYRSGGEQVECKFFNQLKEIFGEMLPNSDETETIH